MHNNTVISLLMVCCLAFLSFVSAQENCGAPNLGGNGASCSQGLCCSSANFCGNDDAHCGQGCQSLYGSCNGSGGGSFTPSPSASLSPFTPSPTITSPSASPSVSIATTTITTTIATTRTRTRSRDSETTTKGTFQFQPTGKPSGATSSQDKGVKSTVALAVVFFAGLMMV